MIRTQIQFTTQQAERLRRAAHLRGVSISALVREAVDAADLDSGLADRRLRALAVVGGFRSGGQDGSSAHDRHLGEAYRS